MRLQGWEARLAAAIDKHRHLPFELGTSDCLLLGLDAALALTGEDPCAEFRTIYKSETDIARNFLRLGCRDVGNFLAQHFPDEIAPSFASRGDLVVVKQVDQIAVAVCIGVKLLGKAQSGLTFTSRSHAIRAFRV